MDVPVFADEQEHLYHLYADTGCSLEDLPGEMVDWDGWKERIREIRAISADLMMMKDMQ